MAPPFSDWLWSSSDHRGKCFHRQIISIWEVWPFVCAEQSRGLAASSRKRWISHSRAITPAVVFIFSTRHRSLCFMRDCGNFSQESTTVVLVSYKTFLWEFLKTQNVLRWNDVLCAAALWVQGVNYICVQMMCAPSFISATISARLREENVIAFPFVIFCKENVGFRELAVTDVCVLPKCFEVWNTDNSSNLLTERQLSVRGYYN